MKPKRGHRPWREFVQDSIRDPKEAAEYLNAAAAQGDSKAFLIALKDVIAVHGGISALSRKTRLNRGNLHRMLAGRGFPRLDSLHRVLGATGFVLKIEPSRAGGKRARRES